MGLGHCGTSWTRLILLSLILFCTHGCTMLNYGVMCAFLATEIGSISVIGLCSASLSISLGFRVNTLILRFLEMNSELNN